MALTITTTSAVLNAVAAFAVHTANGEGAMACENETIVTALREIGSGLLLVERQEDVSVIVHALMPVFNSPEISRCFDWKGFSAAGIQEGVCAYFAHRAADLMTLAQYSSTISSDFDDGTDKNGCPITCLGTLGEAISYLQVIDSIFEHTLENAKFRLEKKVLADILFAVIRVQESSLAVRCEEELERTSSALYKDGLRVSTRILQKLPRLGKGAVSLAGVIRRVWNSEIGGGIHTCLSTLLKAEDKVYDFEIKAARLGLVPASTVIRSLGTAIESADDMDSILSPLLALALPMAGDVNLRRRLDAITVVSHCLRVASIETFRFHSEAVLAALTKSLLWDDCLSSMEAFPVLNKVMTLVDRTTCLYDDPPKVWFDALQEVIRNFVAHVDHRGDSSGETSQAEIDEHLATAAAIAGFIPTMAKSRIIPQLELFMEALRTLLCRAVLMVRRDGAGASHVFEATKDAFIETIQYSWPRVPAHFDQIFRASCGAVLGTRVDHEEDVHKEIMAGAVDILTWASRCGSRVTFNELLQETRELGVKYESLRALAVLCSRVEESTSSVSER